jgi:hypothetical protein
MNTHTHTHTKTQNISRNERKTTQRRRTLDKEKIWPIAKGMFFPEYLKCYCIIIIVINMALQSFVGPWLLF